MIKTLKIALPLVLIALTVFLFKPNIKAEYNIPSWNFTWNCSNPASGIYECISDKLGIDFANDNDTRYILRMHTNAYIYWANSSLTIENINLSILETNEINDTDYIYEEPFMFIDFSTWQFSKSDDNNYTIQFKLRLNNIAGISSTELANTYVETYFGIYSRAGLSSLFYIQSITDYNQGYNTARTQYGEYIDGQWFSYTDGFELGRSNYGEEILGIWKTYNDGYETARGEFGYWDGSDWLDYGDGYTAGQLGENALYQFIPAVIGPMFAFFFQVASFEVMGFSAMHLLAGLAVIGVALTIFKVFLSK